MTTKLCEDAKEGSTFIVPVHFTKPDGQPLAPLSVRWTLMTKRKIVVNGRRHVSIPPLATVNIVLSGPDLRVDEAGKKADRKLLVEAFYNSIQYGDNLTIVEEFDFQIEAATAYPVTTTTTTTTTTTA